MRNIWLLCFLISLASATMTGRKEKRSCRLKLRGTRQLSYFAKHGANSSEARNSTRTKWCVIFARITWTRDFTLELTNNAEEVLPLFYERKRKVAPAVKVLPGGKLVKNLQGNVTTSVKIFIRNSEVNFTLTYATVKARKFECPEIGQGPEGIVLMDCKERSLGSNCTFMSQKFAWTRPSKIEAKCQKNSVGTPEWNIKEDQEGFPDDINAEFLDATEGETPQYLPEYENDRETLCDTSRCNKFPENIQVVSCTDGTNIGSNCTLKCKEGYIPAPHLYEENGILFAKYEKEQLFWSECRYDQRYDIVAMWTPQVSSNGFRNFRNPLESYLDCMEQSVAFELFMGDRKEYIDFSTARDFTSCPYEDDHILHLYGEQSDGLGPFSNEMLPMAQSEERMWRSLPTVMLVQEEILTALNGEEWKEAFTTLRKSWCIVDMKSLKMALFQRPPEKQPNVIQREKIQSVVDQLLALVTECTIPFAEIITGEEEPEPEEPSRTNCAEYCIWDKSRGGYVPCGNFAGLKNKKNCLRCKFNRSCRKSSFLDG